MMKKIDNNYQEEEVSLRVHVPSIILDKEAIRNLWKIIEKAKGTKDTDIKLYVSGDSEYVNAKNIDRLVAARWPKNVEYIELWAVDDGKGMMVVLENHPKGKSRIEIDGADSEWVTARSKEITDFINEHKSWHWMFNNPVTLMIMMVCFSALSWASVAVHYDWSFDKGMYGLMAGILVSGISLQGMPWVYPYVTVNTGLSSTKKLVRNILNYIFPAVGLSIIVNIVWGVWF